MKLKPWTLPPNYFGATWDGWLVFLGKNRDSDCLTRSNFQCGLQAVQKASDNLTVDEMESVNVIQESHWACGWVEWIAIHSSDLGAIAEAERILSALEDYPILDEDHYSQCEEDEAQETWKNCFNDRERLEYIREHRSQFEFHSLSDLLGSVRGRHFGGYASELLH